MAGDRPSPSTTSESPSEISVRMERERIEVTRSGMFGGPIDYEKKFISGLTTYYVTVDGVELPPMTPEEYEVWKTHG